MIEGKSSYDHIVRQRWVNYQEVVSIGYLEGVWANRDRQRYYSLRIHLVSTETDKGGFKWSKSFRVYF